MVELVEHYRYESINVGATKKIHVTFCYLDWSPSITAVGVSICSWRDQRNRKLGRTIARGRAEKALRTKGASCPVRKMNSRKHHANWLIHTELTHKSWLIIREPKENNK